MNLKNLIWKQTLALAMLVILAPHHVRAQAQPLSSGGGVVGNGMIEDELTEEDETAEAKKKKKKKKAQKKKKKNDVAAACDSASGTCEDGVKLQAISSPKSEKTASAAAQKKSAETSNEEIDN